MTELRRWGNHPLARFAFLGLAGAANFLHDFLRDFLLGDLLHCFLLSCCHWQPPPIEWIMMLYCIMGMLWVR